MLLRRVFADLPRLRRAGVLAAALLVSAPVVAAAAPRHEAAPSQDDVTIALGNVYGGVTPQLWPVVVEVNGSRRKITRMIIGLRLQCTSGVLFRMSDGWEQLRIRRGEFRSSFGPEVETDDQGATSTTEGTVSGKFNRLGTKVSGIWTFKATFADAAGTVTDACDSGVVRWTAKN